MVSTITDRLQGFSLGAGIKAPCYVATDGTNLTLSGAQTVDGISVGSCQRVLVKDQTDAAENGIYISDASTWVRAKDADGARDLKPGTLVYVDRGSANSDSFWVFNSSSTALSLAPGSDDLTLSDVTLALAGVSDFGNTLITADSSASALELLGGVSTTSILDPTRLDIAGMATRQIPAQIFPWQDFVAAYSENSSTIEQYRIADLSRRPMSNSTGNETLVASDGMTIIRYTGDDGSTITLPFVSSASIDNGWFVDVFHDGSTGLFVAPSSLGQTIDGSTQVFVSSGEHVRVQWNTGDLWSAKRWATMATTAEVLAATATGVFIAPGTLQYHPGAAKAWGVFNGFTVTTSTDLTGVGDSHNLASIIDNGTGDYTLNWTTAFGSTNYVVVGMARNAPSGGASRFVMYDDGVEPSTASCRIVVDETGSVRTDSTTVSFVAFGDQ